MRAADLEVLKERIIRPDFSDERLYPLMRYRGSYTLGRARRMWNFAILMQESECATFTEGTKIYRNPDFSHLCGPNDALKMTSGSIKTFFSRLYHNQKVSDNIPGLTDYVRDCFSNTSSWSQAIPWHLEPVSAFTHDSHCKVPWRTYQATPRKPRIYRPREAGVADLVYPFLIHRPKNGGAEYDMMMAINEAVPKHLPPDMRADICQDLLVELLLGNTTVDALRGEAKPLIRQVTRANRSRYGDVSLDEVVAQDDDRTGYDKIAAIPSGMEW